MGRWGRASGVVGLAVLGLGCGQAVVPEHGGRVVTEADSTLWVFHADAWQGGLAPSEPGETVFELGTLVGLSEFDRVGARWDATLPVGATLVLEVRTGADAEALHAWQALQVVYDDSGLFSGVIDVAPAQALEARVRMSTATTVEAPTLTFLAVETFARISFAGADADLDGSFEPPAGGPQFAVAQPDIVTRAEWGAADPICSIGSHTPYRATFHHTVTPNGETGSAARSRVKNIQHYHQNVRGWCDIGYHLLVDDAGELYRGRSSTSRRGAHVGGQNSGNVGLAYLGDFYNGITASDAQMSGAAEALAWVADTWGFAANGTNIRGHQEWPGQSTGCPGSILDDKDELLDEVQAIIDGEPPPPPEDPTVIVIDNDSAGFTASGNWGLSTWSGQRHGSNYRYRLTASESDLATWSAELEDTGDWEVFVWYTAHDSRTPTAPYRVHHAGGIDVVTVNQQSTGGEWVSLGTYTLPAGSADRVSLSCWTVADDYVIADAVKLEAQ